MKVSDQVKIKISLCVCDILHLVFLYIFQFLKKPKARIKKLFGQRTFESIMSCFTSQRHERNVLNT